MDINFYTRGGSSFSIKVSFDDTVKDIKEKIQKYQNIPISKHALFLNRQLLQDDVDIRECGIHQNSRIELLITAEDAKIQLNIKVSLNFPVEMDKNDTVLKLKEKIHEIDSNFPINRLILKVKGAEL